MSKKIVIELFGLALIGTAAEIVSAICIPAERWFWVVLMVCSGLVAIFCKPHEPVVEKLREAGRLPYFIAGLVFFMGGFHGWASILPNTWRALLVVMYLVPLFFVLKTVRDYFFEKKGQLRG